MTWTPYSGGNEGGKDREQSGLVGSPERHDLPAMPFAILLVSNYLALILHQNVLNQCDQPTPDYLSTVIDKMLADHRQGNSRSSYTAPSPIGATQKRGHSTT